MVVVITPVVDGSSPSGYVTAGRHCRNVAAFALVPIDQLVATAEHVHEVQVNLG